MENTKDSTEIKDLDGFIQNLRMPVLTRSDEVMGSVPVLASTGEADSENSTSAKSKIPAFFAGLRAVDENDPDTITLENLYRHLHIAMKLELATIPPYLLAMYTMYEGDMNDPQYRYEFGDNALVRELIREVVVEEMLHLTIVGNLLIVVGGKPILNKKEGVVTQYPAPLPNSADQSFLVNLDHFNRSQIKSFAILEMPSLDGDQPELDGYHTIGQMYEGIIKLLEALEEKQGNIYHPENCLQIDSKYYYNSGGKLEPIKDLKSAKKGIELIIEQGEGIVKDTRSWLKALLDPLSDEERELPISAHSHFLKYVEIIEGRRYRSLSQKQIWKLGGCPLPDGDPIEVKWKNVYETKKNPLTSDYKEDNLREKSHRFNLGYRALLDCIQISFEGHPEKMVEAVQIMYKLRYAAMDLIRTPFKDGYNASPTFQFLSDEDIEVLNTNDEAFAKAYRDYQAYFKSLRTGAQHKSHFSQLK